MKKMYITTPSYGAPVAGLFAAIPMWSELCHANSDSQGDATFSTSIFHGNKAISSTQSMPVYPMDFIPNLFFIFLVHFSVVYKTSLRVVTQKVSCK